MSHIYQPVMLMTLLKNKGKASVKEIAQSILNQDPTQIEYYSEIVKNMVGKVLTKNRGITEIAITGNRPDLVESLTNRWMPTAVVTFGEPFDSPLWHDRRPDFAYVCQNYVCSAPASTVEQLQSALELIS